MINNENGMNQNNDSLPINNQTMDQGIPMPPVNNVEQSISTPVVNNEQIKEEVVIPQVNQEVAIPQVNEVTNNLEQVNNINNQNNIVPNNNLGTVNDVMNNVPTNPTPEVNGTLSSSINNTNPTPEPQQDNIMDLLVQAYVGPNSSILLYDNFNWSAFFFSSLYCFFRKMHLLGLIELFAFGFSASYIREKFGYLPFIIFYIVSCIVEGSIFNKLYASKASRKVRKLIEKNPGMGKEDLLMKASKKGGRSILHMILGIIYVVAIIFAYAGLSVLFTFGSISMKYNIPFTSFFKKDKSAIVERRGNTGSNEIRIDPNYSVTYINVDIDEKFEYEKIKDFNFEKTFYDGISMQYKYENDKKIKHYCTLMLHGVLRYKDAEELAKGVFNASNTSDYSNVKKGTVQGENLTWNYVIRTDSYETTEYYYYAKKENIVYNLVYEYKEKEAPDICKFDVNEYVKKVKFKE